MSKSLKITFLGSGSAVGVPMIGCHCAVCLSSHKANKRTRTAILIEKGSKKYILDPGPDIRAQMIGASLKHIDGILITHCHYDHIGGFDDLRVIAIKEESILPTLIHKRNTEELIRRCGYLFRPGSSYFKLQELTDDQGIETFEGLKFRYFTYVQNGMNVTGFVIDEVAFVSDIQSLDGKLVEQLTNVDTLIVSCLVKPYSPYKSHLSLEEVEVLKAQTGAKTLILTHLGHDADYESLSKRVDSDTLVSYDGFSFEVN